MSTEFQEIIVGQSKDMPSKIVIYGVPKIGKSRFASQIDDVFFINIEGGLDYIGKSVRSTPKLNTYDEVIGWLKHIYDNDDFKASTIAIDSLDWLEGLAQARLIKMENAKSIVDPLVKSFAYSKGYEMASADTIIALKWLDAIYNKKGIRAIAIAHSTIKNVDLPTQDPYSRHELKLYKTLAAKANEWADLVLFADYSFHVTKEGKPTEPKPRLFAGGSAAFVGGGRMQLSRELPLDYNELKKAITQ